MYIHTESPERKAKNNLRKIRKIGNKSGVWSGKQARLTLERATAISSWKKQSYCKVKGAIGAELDLRGCLTENIDKLKENINRKDKLTEFNDREENRKMIVSRSIMWI